MCPVARSVGVGGAKQGWLPNDLNKGRVDLFFLTLAGACKFRHEKQRLLAAIRP